MRRGGGAAKGSAFERRVCRDFGLWLTNGKRSDIFWRVAMSGGRATLQHRKGFINIAQLGDIGAIDPEGVRLTNKFIVEAKHVKSLDLVSYFIKRKGIFTRFWKKLLPVCHKHRRQPLIIACENRLPVRLITTVKGAAVLRVTDIELARAGDVRFFLLDEVLKRSCPL
jgi:hypothetical protein